MARYIKSATTGENKPATMWVLVGASQTINVGDLLAISSGKAIAAVAASAAIIGIAEADITTGASPTSADKIPVTLAKDAVIRIAYTGSSKTSLADADMYGTKYDLSDKKTLNLDDTTGGMCHVVGYDNTADTADIVINDANLIY